MSLLGAWGVRNGLSTFFCKNGYGESTGWEWNPPVETFTPLAYFIFTKGVDAWKEVNDADGFLKPNFDANTVISLTLAGCIFSKKIHDEIQQIGASSPKHDYFDKKFYKELCSVADDNQRALMRWKLEPFHIDYDKTGKAIEFAGQDEKGKDIWVPVNP